MNKAELITRVAERTGMTKKDTDKTINVTPIHPDGKVLDPPGPSIALGQARRLNQFAASFLN